jgi:hypothetical protein
MAMMAITTNNSISVKPSHRRLLQTWKRGMRGSPVNQDDEKVKETTNMFQ